MKPRWFQRTFMAAVVVVAGLLASCTTPGAPPIAGNGSPSPKTLVVTPEMRAREEIQARYDTMSQALRNKSIAAYMESFASDYTYRNEIGEVDDRAAVRAQMIDALGYTDTLDYSAHVEDCRLEGDRAQVRVSEVLTSTRKDKGTRRVIEVRHDMQSTWIRDPKGWKISRARELSSSTTMDGKPPAVAFPSQGQPSASPPVGSPPAAPTASGAGPAAPTGASRP